MQVNRPSNPSFLWNSLLEGRRVVGEGSRWKVGDGNSIDALKDKWLKIPPIFKPRGPPNQEPTPLKVSVLIDEERRKWNMEHVKEIFTEEEANVIERIPLSRTPSLDRLIWTDSITGDMTVKSAYVTARVILGKMIVNRELRDPVQRWMWTARVIPKVKYFMWKTVQGILPTMDNLQGRRLQVDNACPVCGCQNESSIHVFYFCIFSKAVWNDLCPEILQVDFSDESQSWRRAFGLWRSRDIVEQCMNASWLIWINRNNCYHNKTCKNPTAVVRQAMKMHDELISSPNTNGIHLQEMVPRWEPPPPGKVKLNVDASSTQDMKAASVGLVIRKASGTVEASAQVSQILAESPLHAELLAIKLGLEIGKELHFQHI
ncbi:hypothetical protein DITRI_Ditri06bG0020100 [Diplodiscus trichospermus]